MTFYLGSYASAMDAECARDNNLDASDLAEPTGCLLLGRDAGHVQALLDAAWSDNVTDVYMSNKEDDDNEPPPPDPDWKTDGWVEANTKGNRVGYQIWTSEHAECVVILREIVPLEPVGGPQ